MVYPILSVCVHMCVLSSSCHFKEVWGVGRVIQQLFSDTCKHNQLLTAWKNSMDSPLLLYPLWTYLQEPLWQYSPLISPSLPWFLSVLCHLGPLLGPSLPRLTHKLSFAPPGKVYLPPHTWLSLHCFIETAQNSPLPHFQETISQFPENTAFTIPYPSTSLYAYCLQQHFTVMYILSHYETFARTTCSRLQLYSTLVDAAIFSSRAIFKKVFFVFLISVTDCFFV